MLAEFFRRRLGRTMTIDFASPIIFTPTRPYLAASAAESGVVAILHLAHVDRHDCGAFGAEGSLRQRVSRAKEIGVDSSGGQPQESLSRAVSDQKRSSGS